MNDSTTDPEWVAAQAARGLTYSVGGDDASFCRVHDLCPVCRESVDDADAHFPHDMDCRNWGRHPIRGEFDPYPCYCDRAAVHPECCSECQVEVTRAAFMAKLTKP